MCERCGEVEVALLALYSEVDPVCGPAGLTLYLDSLRAQAYF